MGDSLSYLDNLLVLVITGASRRLEPVIKCCLLLSFFRSLVSRAPLSAVTNLYSRQLKAFQTKIIAFGGTKTSTTFTSDHCL